MLYAYNGPFLGWRKVSENAEGRGKPKLSRRPTKDDRIRHMSQCGSPRSRKKAATIFSMCTRISIGRPRANRSGQSLPRFFRRSKISLCYYILIHIVYYCPGYFRTYPLFWFGCSAVACLPPTSIMMRSTVRFLTAYLENWFIVIIIL